MPAPAGARPPGTVATPLHWAEPDDPALGPRRWTARTLPDRLDKDGGP
ncbi:hypothetical protein [Actinacidiphila sp. bgisy160]